MITCTLTYDIDLAKLGAFDTYARMWIHLVERLGGRHHGSFPPREGAGDRAWAMLSFDSLATCRAQMAENPECRAAYRFAGATGGLRRFTRPVLDGAAPAELGVAS